LKLAQKLALSAQINISARNVIWLWECLEMIVAKLIGPARALNDFSNSKEPAYVPAYFQRSLQQVMLELSKFIRVFWLRYKV
jgi:hypothetical protein